VTDRQGQAVLALRVGGQSYAAIAARTACPLNTVKSFCLRHAETVEALRGKKICRQCGVKLEQRTKQKRRSFCCDRCRAAWWAAHRDCLNCKAFYSFCCAQCGQNFTAYGNSHRKFCSRQCFYASKQIGGNDHDKRAIPAGSHLRRGDGADG
jgi:hypothetical protein